MPKQEIERRFLVHAMDRSVLTGPGKLVVQGYLQSPPRMSLRVRVTDEREAHLARKEGAGRVRREEEIWTDLGTAQFHLGTCTDVVIKRRWLLIHDGQEWSVDVFAPPLQGIIIAEAELQSADTLLTLPPWIVDATEVTETLSSWDLARLATDVHGLEEMPPLSDLLTHRVRKIVLTGGPCSGKTSIMTLLRAEFENSIHCVPETVSYLIQQIGAKPPIGNVVGMRRYNRNLTKIQRGIEQAAELQAAFDGKRALLLDRGVCDNTAYLDGGFPVLERLLGTTREHEFQQYDLVICMETPSRVIYEAKSRNNPARYEASHEIAMEVSRRTREAWDGHSNLVVVPSEVSWEDKVDFVTAAVGSFLEQSSATPRHG